MCYMYDIDIFKHFIKPTDITGSMLIQKALGDLGGCNGLLWEQVAGCDVVKSTDLLLSSSSRRLLDFGESRTLRLP